MHQRTRRNIDAIDKSFYNFYVSNLNKCATKNAGRVQIWTLLPQQQNEKKGTSCDSAISRSYWTNICRNWRVITRGVIEILVFKKKAPWSNPLRRTWRTNENVLCGGFTRHTHTHTHTCTCRTTFTFILVQVLISSCIPVPLLLSLIINLVSQKSWLVPRLLPPQQLNSWHHTITKTRVRP